MKRLSPILVSMFFVGCGKATHPTTNTQNNSNPSSTSTSTGTETSVTYVVSKVAGSGDYNFSGDGAAALNAGIYPMTVTVDGAGNIYFLDVSSGIRVRKIDVSTGIITTVAGGSNTGFSGDGGLAVGAEFGSQTYRVVADQAGNLFIIDFNNYRVRKVTASSGIVNTIVGNGTYGTSGDGGPALNAEIRPYDGLAVDSNGDLFLNDPTRIRKVDASTNIISTIAGFSNGLGSSGDGGVATSAYVEPLPALAADASGDVYLTEGLRIREISSATDIINTVAGNGSPGDTGNNGPALAASIFGGTNDSQDIALDGQGNLYIADWDFSNIRMVRAATGAITQIVDTYHFGNPRSLAVDKSGNIYFVGGYSIWRATPN